MRRRIRNATRRVTAVARGNVADKAGLALIVAAAYTWWGAGAAMLAAGVSLLLIAYQPD